MAPANEIRTLVEKWARGVQEKDWEAIVAWHHDDIVMYDVPPPFRSLGVDAYRKTWEDFLPSLVEGAHSFQVLDLQITAGGDVAFCHSPMKCIYHDKREGKIELDFRLTIGFKKIDGHWWFMHEHHSIPATS